MYVQTDFLAILHTRADEHHDTDYMSKGRSPVLLAASAGSGLLEL